MLFHYAAVLLDAWLDLRGLVASAWRALPGDLMALVVLRGCGIPSDTRRTAVAEDGTTAILVEHPAAGRYLDRQWIPVTAQTLGRYVFSREPLTAELVGHELEHVRQWRRLGPLFLPAYVASSGLAALSGRQPYEANRFEVAAREAALRGIGGPARP